MEKKDESLRQGGEQMSVIYREKKRKSVRVSGRDRERESGGSGLGSVGFSPHWLRSVTRRSSSRLP